MTFPGVEHAPGTVGSNALNDHFLGPECPLFRIALENAS